MTAQSISDVVQQAVKWTGMEQVPVRDRTRARGREGLTKKNAGATFFSCSAAVCRKSHGSCSLLRKDGVEIGNSR